MLIIISVVSGPKSNQEARVRLIDVFSVLYTYNIRSKAWFAAWVLAQVLHSSPGRNFDPHTPTLF